MKLKETENNIKSSLFRPIELPESWKYNISKSQNFSFTYNLNDIETDAVLINTDIDRVLIGLSKVNGFIILKFSGKEIRKFHYKLISETNNIKELKRNLVKFEKVADYLITHYKDAVKLYYTLDRDLDNWENQE